MENSLSTYEPHGCVVIYSVVARSSFRVAEEIVNYLWNEHVTRDKAVILVGNKADLARSRVIQTAGETITIYFYLYNTITAFQFIYFINGFIFVLLYTQTYYLS